MPETELPKDEKSFGRRLQELRRHRGLTQRGLAGRVGIDFTYLSKLENGRGEPPSDQTVVKLAGELEADAEELLALAGKIPAELREKAADDPEFALLLRRLPSLPKDVMDRIYKNAKIPRRDKSGPEDTR